jgi:hypothetical protein
MNVIKNEPVLIQSLVQAILGLVLAFGVDLSNEQTGSIMAVVAVILAIIARMFVTPTNKIDSAPPVPPAVEPTT